jgi:hypothetical protein
MAQTHERQTSLFIPTTTIIESPTDLSGSSSDAAPTATNHEELALNTITTREDLIAQIIVGLASGRRWERQLVVGATDDELSRSFGTCWVHSQRYTVAFATDPTPHAICSDLNDNEILTITAHEIAVAVRAFTKIPEDPGPEETNRLIAEELERQRIIARTEIFYSVKSIIKDPAKKKEIGFTQQFVNLLFTENCLLEENEDHILRTMTTMLTDRQWRTADAMKAALDIVSRAQMTWRMVESYWRNLPGDWWEPSHYIPAPTPKPAS